MKKEEDAAKKKKPKTSPAQLRVQKGELLHQQLGSSRPGFLFTPNPGLLTFALLFDMLCYQI